MFSNMLSPQYFNAKEQELFSAYLKEFLLYQQHAIQRHLALKELFGPQYVFMKPEVIMKELKYLYPVTTSPSLPSRK